VPARPLRRGEAVNGQFARRLPSAYDATLRTGDSHVVTDYEELDLVRFFGIGC
jgi:hypothetical protein